MTPYEPITKAEATKSSNHEVNEIIESVRSAAELVPSTEFFTYEIIKLCDEIDRLRAALRRAGVEAMGCSPAASSEFKTEALNSVIAICAAADQGYDVRAESRRKPKNRPKGPSRPRRTA